MKFCLLAARTPRRGAGPLIFGLPSLRTVLGRSDLLLQSVVSSTFFDMPAINVSPALFEIETASPEADDPENEMFVIRMRLQGTYEVREFLSDHGIDEKRIAFAIEELSRNKRVKVSHQVWKGRAV